MAKECLNCGEETKKLYRDPCDPPLEIRPCLCDECLYGFFEEEHDRLVSEVYDELRAGKSPLADKMKEEFEL